MRPAGVRRSGTGSTEICWEVSEAINEGARIIVLSDRGVRNDHADPLPRPGDPAGPAHGAATAPIPSLLLTGAVHHHLIRQRTRTKVGLVVESGDARECHHVALLIGYGASAVAPYLAVQRLVRDTAHRGGAGGRRRGQCPREPDQGASARRVPKIMSRLVSTVAS